MADVRVPTEDDLPAVAGLVAGLQADPAHLIASLGVTAADIAASIREWAADWTGHCRIVRDDGNGTLTGFAGVEVDLELGRAWVHGPLVAADGPAWDEAADALLGALLAGPVPDTVHDVELNSHLDNVRLARLAARHGFTAGVVNRALELRRSTALALPPIILPALDPAHHDAVAALHDRLFPGTYYSGRQLVAQAVAGEATILQLVEDGGLVGYAAGRVDNAGEGYLDFVGVDESARRAGAGRRLVTAFAQTICAEPAVPRVCLSVREDNEPALALYAALGWTIDIRMVGYRRKSGPPA